MIISDELFLTKEDVYKTIDMLEQAVAEIKRIAAQHDQLLEALKGALKCGRGSSGRIIIEQHYEDAINRTIAAVEQSK